VNFVTAGRALLLDLGQGPHLWFVLTDPDVHERVVLAMLVTARPHTDKTVALVAGDHSFVQHESNVNYSTATFASSARLNALLAKGRGKLLEDVSTAVLLAVRCGLLSSSRTANEVVDYCRALFGSECSDDG